MKEKAPCSQEMPSEAFRVMSMSPTYSQMAVLKDNHNTQIQIHRIVRQMGQNINNWWKWVNGMRQFFTLVTYFHFLDINIKISIPKLYKLCFQFLCLYWIYYYTHKENFWGGKYEFNELNFLWSNTIYNWLGDFSMNVNMLFNTITIVGKQYVSAG